MSGPADPAALLLDAVLTPHRSLAPKGFLALMAALAAGAASVGLLFASRGAWPVLPFLGGEVLLVWVAFRVNYRRGAGGRLGRSARPAATPQLRAAALAARGAGAAAGPRPPPRRGEHGRALAIGRFLAPEEKASFAQALAAAIGRLDAPMPSSPAGVW
ncbi:MAG: DUF2244 domain-containing protein, partial [Alphaproteobacteria bacterium]|nr:DUF2244 domain-containing protein [Alphaproteobacteria bacterium]